MSTLLLRRSEGTSRSLWLLLAAVVTAAWIAVAADGGTFWTVHNLQNIGQRSVALGVVSVGQAVVVIAGSLDLSVAYMVSVAAIATSVVMNGKPALTVPGVLVALALGAVVGLVNGFVVTVLRVDPFIATLGVALILQGAVNASFNNFAGSVPDSFRSLGYDAVAGIPISVLMFAAIVAAAWYLLHRTRFGHHLYAVGGNAESARLSGVRTKRVLTGAHVLCGMCAAAAGVFLASRLGSGAPWVGPDGGYDLDSITAVVLGGAPLAGGRGRVLGIVAAVLLLGVLDSVFDQFQIDPFLRTLVRGVIIIGSVAIYVSREAGERG